jgi:hypothetical protein
MNKRPTLRSKNEAIRPFGCGLSEDISGDMASGAGRAMYAVDEVDARSKWGAVDENRLEAVDGRCLDMLSRPSDLRGCSIDAEGIDEKVLSWGVGGAGCIDSAVEGPASVMVGSLRVDCVGGALRLKRRDFLPTTFDVTEIRRIIVHGYRSRIKRRPGEVPIM